MATIGAIIYLLGILLIIISLVIYATTHSNELDNTDSACDMPYWWGYGHPGSPLEKGILQMEERKASKAAGNRRGSPALR